MSIRLPERCLRGLDDCTALAQIESDGGQSFVCCGHSDPETRTVGQDRFRVCWKSQHVDETGDYDEVDMKDTISVLAQALSVDGHMRRGSE